MIGDLYQIEIKFLRNRKGENMNTTNNFITIDSIPYYKINDSQKLLPFFIQAASSSDIWLFMSSNGGVTAGRENAQNSIFPYETDDKLHSNYESCSKTILKIGSSFWQPFEVNGVQKYDITRNIYKGYYGDSIMMEEINHDLGISFSYKYESSEKYGLVKTSKYTNLTATPLNIEVLDGVGNLLPYGVNEVLQATKSTLVDAYKASELAVDKLGIFSLTTQINDTPNPIEVLKANIAYTTLDDCTVYLDPHAVKAFYDGTLCELSQECYGKKSAYFVHFSTELKNSYSYSTILDIGYDHTKLSSIITFIDEQDFSSIYSDIKNGTEKLKKLVGDADGLQSTGDQVACAAHYLNTLYNVMRGGTFESEYAFSYDDFYHFLTLRNKGALENKVLLDELKACTTIHELKEIATKDKTIYRLALEYLPLSFSRRHGDPSRPWNKFNIALKDDNGNKISFYEGNWRDIFQNWEALGLSYPCYYENMIAKFVNASTIDGFNPYRINSQGIDWEKPEEDNPFGGYGYWGDHQIIYLLRLLKGLMEHFPAQLNDFLSLDIFTYANVPYVIKSYDELLNDSKDTILFDFERDEAVEALCERIGSDGKLVQKNSEVYMVNLTEKLLVPLLSKISNLVVGGGIWMNTQRPEWNDANNAIVGIGLSMVTVYHLKAYLIFLNKIYTSQDSSYQLSKEVAGWMQSLATILTKYNKSYNGKEKEILDEMGQVFSDYRTLTYHNGFTSKETVDVTSILDSLAAFESAIDYTIEQNKGNVYSTYNLLSSDFDILPMRAMLEGQTAAIGSECLDDSGICNLLTSMKSELYDEKAKYHTLYPVVKTSRFLDKNILTANLPIIDGITQKDTNGVLHFAPTIITEQHLIEALEIADVTSDLKELLLTEFDRVFAHKSFTGRSQVMYKFEGIGCVYWHQNAKLALAVLEGVSRARKSGQDASALYKAYKNLMDGFIYRKTPTECNAIPIEPYSHTSFNRTSEQPGMTGQVKESVIMRRMELGVFVEDGILSFDPWFLSDLEIDEKQLLEFTIYGIPTKYVFTTTSTDKVENCIPTISVLYTDGQIKTFTNGKLDKDISKEIFQRNSMIKEIQIEL